MCATSYNSVFIVEMVLRRNHGNQVWKPPVPTVGNRGICAGMSGISRNMKKGRPFEMSGGGCDITCEVLNEDSSGLTAASRYIRVKCNLEHICCLFSVRKLLMSVFKLTEKNFANEHNSPDFREGFLNIL